MRRKVLILSVVIALLATASFGTLAYVTHTSTAENVITAGNVDLELIQNGEVTDGVLQIMPGDRVTAETVVKNAGDHPVYVRVSLAPEVTGGSADDIPQNVEEVMLLNINDADWTLGEDGYYYYNQVLQPGETSEEIFDLISFDGTKMDNTYLGRKVTLTVNAYAVQSENNGSAVAETIGWPAE